ncbi:unnamed protein product [Withania somnifera]
MAVPFGFEDYFPWMMERLGRNTMNLGLNDLRDDELICMLTEGDLDGDGAFNQMEFCILMFRLSPGLMDGSKKYMDDLGLIDFQP